MEECWWIEYDFSGDCLVKSLQCSYTYSHVKGVVGIDSIIRQTVVFVEHE